MRRNPLGRARAACIGCLAAAAAITTVHRCAWGDTGAALGTFTWTDRGGNTHVLKGTYTNGFYNTALSSGNVAGPSPFAYTDNNGQAFYNGSSLFGSIDFYGNLSANFGAGNVSYFQIFDTSSVEYTRRWPDNVGFVNASGGGTTNFNYGVDNTTFSGAAFGIGQALLHAANYADSLGASAPYLKIYYDSTTEGSFYQKNSPNTPYLQIDSQDWASWDVIMHEYGHHVAAHNNLDASPGGPHSFGGDNIRGTDRPAGGGMPPNPPAGTGLGADQGSKLAWSEGFATYYGLTAVRAGNLAGFVAGLPSGDYDDWYDDFDAPGSTALYPAQSNFAVRAEAPRVSSGTAPTLFDGVRRGEGDEYSVLLAMWDYFDDTNEAFTGNTSYHAKTQQWTRDRVNYGDRDAWTRLITSGGGAKTFRNYWTNITADASTAIGRAKISGLATNFKDEAIAALGETLEAAGISAVPLTPDGNQQVFSFRPTFTLFEQNNSNSEWFRILVFSNDWSSIVFGSGLLADPNNTVGNLNYTPSVDLPMGTFWWVVLNSPAGALEADVTGNANRYAMYWSGARQFTVVPAPATALCVLGVIAFRRKRR